MIENTTSQPTRTKMHHGATCQTCGVKLNSRNAQRWEVSSTGTRGVWKGHRVVQMERNYSHCRNCAAPVRIELP